MSYLRRYWAPALILIMVAVHAAAIGYVRSSLARMNHTRSAAIEIGSFRFQPLKEPKTVYHFRLHAILDPSKQLVGEERLKKMRMEILESAEQMLRQVDPQWLSDPAQTQLRDRLMSVVLEHLDEPLVQRVLITDWLAVPVEAVRLDLAEPTAA